MCVINRSFDPDDSANNVLLLNSFKHACRQVLGERSGSGSWASSSLLPSSGPSPSGHSSGGSSISRHSVDSPSRAGASGAAATAADRSETVTHKLSRWAEHEAVLNASLVGKHTTQHNTHSITKSIVLHTCRTMTQYNHICTCCCCCFCYWVSVAFASHLHLHVPLSQCAGGVLPLLHWHEQGLLLGPPSAVRFCEKSNSQIERIAC